MVKRVPDGARPVGTFPGEGALGMPSKVRGFKLSKRPTAELPPTAITANPHRTQVSGVSEVGQQGFSLDFDRSLPPIMPKNGADFNRKVDEIVIAANGDEKLISEAFIEMPPYGERASDDGIEMLTYPAARPALDRYVVVSKPGEHEVRGVGGRQMRLELGRHATNGEGEIHG